MNTKILSKKTPNIAFYSIYDEKSALKFECVVGSNVTHNFPMHIHNSLCIGLISQGERTIVWSNKSEIVKQNELFIINKNEPHAINQTEPHNYIVITVKNKVNCAVFKNVIKSEMCLSLFLQLFDALKENNTNCLFDKWENLYQHLIDTHQSFDFRRLNNRLLKKSLEYIQNNYQQQISVADIAAHSCMSTYHFCRQFKQLAGLSPHNYLKQYRLSQAYTYLQKNTSVFDTAIETGFYDSSHFIKTFHSYMAVSPKEYQLSITKQ